MSFDTSIIPDACTCDKRRDPDALRQAALAERFLFLGGVYTDARGRMVAAELVRRGYPEVVVMRLAGRETRP